MLHAPSRDEKRVSNEMMMNHSDRPTTSTVDNDVDVNFLLGCINRPETMMRLACKEATHRCFRQRPNSLEKEKLQLDNVARACFSSFAPSDFFRRRSSSSLHQPISLQDFHGRRTRLLYHGIDKNKPIRNTQIRAVSSWLPEVVQNFSIWGGTGYMLKTLHFDGAVPYWACFAMINAMLRTALIPLVIHSAKTSARFASVAPELQFIVTLFQNDLKKMRAEGKSLTEQRFLFMQNLQTIRGIYKLHNINPLTVFLSPLLQIPFFYYVAVDLRKIVNGADPALAQELTESSFYWVPDLIEPDPWYGLPIAAGVMLYTNVEVAIGKRSLSGPIAEKSDFAGLLKDLFQTLAVFMPCLAAQSPAGIQIYLVSSFTFTLFQGAALRNDAVRGLIGLPSMGVAPTEPKYAKEFMEFKKLEQKAREIRGDGPVLGRNVLAVGFETSFPGSNRPTTIEGSGIPPPDMIEAPTLSEKPKLDVSQATAAWGGQFIHGISAPMEQLEAQMAEHFKKQEAKEIMAKEDTSEREYMAQPSVEAMEAANKGVVIPRTNIDEPKAPEKINARRFKRNKEKSTSKTRRKR